MLKKSTLIIIIFVITIESFKISNLYKYFVLMFLINFTANTFSGSLSNDLNAQEDLVRYFGKVFRSQKNDFKQIQQITGARVPIVKFYHCPSRLYCDLSFKSGLSTHNTKLVR